ncbi:MAG: M13 family metallopeptidase [Bacteroidales bacterium]|nr:M13 family metallopeptidase [Candidatus Liminaster caballi]
MKKLIYAIMLCALAMTTACKHEIKTTGLNYDYLDTTARPGDDFYKFATGHWLDHNPQPAEYPVWDAFGVIAEKNTRQLADLIQNLASKPQAKGSIEQKIGDLYNLAMDSVRRNELGAEPIRPYLERLYAINSREDFLRHCAEEHDDILFSLFVSADEKNSSNNIVCVSQSGLSLGMRDYYLSNDPSVAGIREAFKQHMVNLYMLCGFDSTTSVKKMQTVMRMETELAGPSYPMELMRDPEANYHKMSVDDLIKTTNGFDWHTYLNIYKYNATDSVDLGQPEPVAYACKMLMTAPLEDLKTIYEWQVISSLSGLLSDDFINENFAFSQVISGAQEMSPRWKRAVSLVDGVMGEPVGQMYVQRYFPESSKQKMLDLVHNLQAVLGERIMAQEWMSDETKQVAMEKLNAFYIKIGYPDKWDDISGLSIDPELNLVDNMHNASKFYWQLSYDKKYNKPVDRDEWGMSPQTVNAYYNPTTNEICFPAAILQPPFFDANADEAVNYGAIGVVIGHEMTHGFDDQGRQYDKNGNLRQWWADSDVEAFNVPAEALAAHYDTLWVIPGELQSNGHQCLGENLADHGGVNIAFQAYKKATADKQLMTENGFTPDQRFFLSFGNIWAEVSSLEMLRYYAIMDVHSAAHLRVNGTLPQIDYWYDAFDIQPGDSLYIAPENRVRIW